MFPGRRTDSLLRESASNHTIGEYRSVS